MDSKTVKGISFFVKIVILVIAIQMNRKTLTPTRITKGFRIIDRIAAKIVVVVEGGRTVIAVVIIFVVVLGVVIIITVIAVVV